MSERPGRCSGRCPRLQRKKALALADRDVVDGSFAALPQATLVELPLLVAVGAKPGAGPVVELVDEPDGDAVAGERPDLLDQPVLHLAPPLANGECLDRGPAR